MSSFCRLEATYFSVLTPVSPRSSSSFCAICYSSFVVCWTPAANSKIRNQDQYYNRNHKQRKSRTKNEISKLTTPMFVADRERADGGPRVGKTPAMPRVQEQGRRGLLQMQRGREDRCLALQERAEEVGRRRRVVATSSVARNGQALITDATMAENFRLIFCDLGMGCFVAGVGERKLSLKISRPGSRRVVYILFYHLVIVCLTVNTFVLDDMFDVKMVGRTRVLRLSYDRAGFRPAWGESGDSCWGGGEANCKWCPCALILPCVLLCTNGAVATRCRRNILTYCSLRHTGM